MRLFAGREIEVHNGRNAMGRFTGRTAIGLVACASVLGAVSVMVTATAAEPTRPEPSKSTRELARRVQEITDVVLTNHVDPPARQHMVLGGIKGLYRAAGLPVPFGLGRRVSEVTTPEQLAGLLEDVWPKSLVKDASAKGLEEAFLNGLLATLGGGAHLVSAKERKVAEQMEGNRYVGIHIALGMNDEEKRPNLFEVFEGGPADRAGAKKGDILEEVDGVDTKGTKLRDVVDRLRGEEGTDVTVKVRQPGETASRTLKMTRGRLPRTTIRGVRKRTSGDWDVRLDGSHPVGYLRVSEITASTPHELHKLAQQLESEGARALVLDLRALGGNVVHPAVLLADSLLEQGKIGRVRAAQGEMVYQADSDALFRGWPLAVLVDSNTAGTAEWLAAALQDNHRGVLVGTPTFSAMRARPQNAPRIQWNTEISSMVAIGDGSWSVVLPVGRLERGDGRLLASPSSMEAAIAGAQGLLVERARPDEPKSGVQPDYEIKEPGVRRPPQTGREVRVEERGLFRRAQELDLSHDEALKKALELLRDSLKKA